MTGGEARALVGATLMDLEQSGAELGELDAAVGDGDLGVTVVASCRAGREAIKALPDDVTVAALMRTLAGAIGAANPSTLSTLTAAGLESGAASLDDLTDIDRSATIVFLEVVAATIGRLGRSQAGDKTVLDALLPSIEALRRSTTDSLDDMISAAAQGIESTRSTVSRRGRGSWLGERAIGHADPGASVYLRLLQALKRQVAA